MEFKDVENCCCVIKVSEAFSDKQHISCSGVLVSPQTGVILSTGIPFSRYIKDQDCLSSDPRFLSPENFSDKLQIRVSFSSPRDCNQRSRLNAPRLPPHRKQQTVSSKLLMLVNCVEFRQAFLEVFPKADQWRFHGDKEEEEQVRDAQFLSWFAVLKVDVDDRSAGTIPWQRSSSLEKGTPVVACGSPFGSLCLDLFISTLSRGIISNLAGEDNAVILTDARCLPGTEGGGLFVVECADGASLIGLIVSPFGWRENEWIGLTLVCSIHMIIKNIIRCTGAGNVLTDGEPRPGMADLQVSATGQEVKAVQYPTVCFVDSGSVWGSGVFVTKKLVVTCRHVVSGKSAVTLKFNHMNKVLDVLGDVIFCTKASSPYDLALVELRVPVPGAVVPRMSQSFNPGVAVLVVAYGGLGRRCGPSQTCGILSKAICLDHQPVMLQTTCAVQAGASGGAVVQKQTGELLGIVSSNTRDLAARVTYPHLNFSIPVTVFQALLQKFLQTTDINVFKVLNTSKKEVRQVWRLQGQQSKL
ncbi:peroxisomal leader peptide-processing protease [Oryzias melastigma]|uniref:Peroxisomal leader peptide-processing protease n=1 Tax=Oryzias melastigma TaxID=30732 RepID=A0A3B3D2K3_ORYME|nr:peroxisomal leader peptide-processing protease [Oryzias melastigma]